MDTDTKLSENFPKIDNIWSEADENLVIKEEIVSDLEPEPSIPLTEEENRGSEVQTFADFENNKCWDDSNCLGVLKKKNLKAKSIKNEEIEVFLYNKSSCVHDPKNFKMVKRRLRCGSCRSLVCPECCKVMSPNLSSHFLGSVLNKNDVFVCRFCSIIFHSLCALQAHIRIHSMEIPYVCPDCGLIYNNIHFLILHLQNKCFHVYKTARYKCKNCPGLYFKAESFGQHVQKVHLEYVFRCLYCSSLFTTNEEFNSHMSKLHQKQKAQYLNYYRCSLCSNMVIPKFMYEKHIAHHRDNPTLYEIHYQCVCGEAFNAISAFRAHALYCNFKKVLPYQWRFLQGKFKKPEISHYHHNKDLSEPAGLGSSEFKAVDADNRIEEKTSCIEINGTNRNSDAECDIYQVEIEKTVETNKQKVIEISDTEAEVSNMLCGPDILANEGEKIDDKMVESTNSELVKIDMNENMEVVQNFKENEGISKIYDHIPCDHLGYVIKTQCSEGNKNTSQSVCGEIANAEDTENGNYQIVTELDEKTGIMRAKTIPLDEINKEENEEVDNHLNENEYERHTENNEKIFSGFQKSKSNLIKCPFCTLMFPKHNFALQQFKAHVDSNHPDAAINVLVTGEESPETDSLNNHESEMGCSLNSSNPPEEVDNEKNDQMDGITTDTECQVTLTEELLPEKSDLSQIRFSTKKDPLFSDVSISIKSSDQRRAEEYCETLKAVNHQPDSYESKEVETIVKSSESPNENSNAADNEMTEVQKTEFANQDANCMSVSLELNASKHLSWNLPTATVSAKEPKPEERSRRESEVWSELYESLMLAEKLKNKKSSPDSDGKRKSLVSDYSSKRIVKKPKRYGESSDSGKSNCNSDFEEFCIDNDLLEKVNSGETEQEKTDKDGLTKRQKLLLKLENVDGRLAEYLLDLITKKEKMFELYKKHSVPRAGHDLRSYRRKVLNGIKQRGRPFKVLRCHDSLKEKYSLELDSNNKEGVKKKEEYYPESRSFEKKRGRPRKYQDVAKIKERRRSDKEVSFIEKNFEKDENDMSPSKRKRKLSSKLQYYKNLTDDKEDFSSGQVIINKSFDSNKVFACAVCKLIFLESNEFREHVTVHRTEKNMYQCMECGECFVVRPSLEKHLLAFHKIKNTDKYIIDNHCCNVKKEDVEEEPLKENQCKVCKDQFDKASDLTKHFRIHGMAFLKEFRKDGKVK